MLRLIAIGGGELRLRETLPLDAYIVRATGRARPRALFIPTASDDSVNYWNVFDEVYGQELGCETDVLFLVREAPSAGDIRAKIDRADLIYVGGGNTRRMLDAWRRLGVDRWLAEAGQRGVVLSGLSAGAMCWFRHGNSDAPLLEGSAPAGPKTTRITGLGLVDATLCPHMSSEPYRWEELDVMMQTTPGVCIALDDHCAIEVHGDGYRILTARASMTAHRVYRGGAAVRIEPLAATPLPEEPGAYRLAALQPLAQLLAVEQAAAS